MSEDYDYLFKVVLIGDSGVGKTNLLMRFTKDVFNQESKPTIGVEFFTKTMPIEGHIIKAQLWDTAGQERFRAITNVYYRGAVGAIVVFDLTRSTTLENVDKWFKELQQYADPNVVTLLIGNKSDLSEERVISADSAAQVAEKYGAAYIETSARNSQNVSKAFELVIKEIYLAIGRLKDDSTPIGQTEKITIESKEDKKTKEKQCC